ncbi:hypothetical protein V3391_01650 [Luteimonas sp. SMYT11W]|uniref:Uncharacterized protein n=1 Tax=Luteimonas flava TaxID=3115822 RepID=A0ABU7WAD0_9GAMM
MPSALAAEKRSCFTDHSGWREALSSVLGSRRIARTLDSGVRRHDGEEFQASVDQVGCAKNNAARHPIHRMTGQPQSITPATD